MSRVQKAYDKLRSGDLLCGRYQIVEKIDDGGMASVYLANDKNTQSPVAIKVLFSHYWDNDTVCHRFLDEGRIQAMLQHDNIVHVHRIIHDPILAFVMEYVDGHSVEEYLQKNPQLNEQAILEIMLPVMSAIGFAHSKGIIHRDIKPANILLTIGAGGRLVPKVMDFGVAKTPHGGDITAAGTTVGTLHYMSPEQVVGSRNIDGRADIYSLGITLYKLCVGEVPFNAPSEFTLMMAQVEAAPKPPRQLRPDLSQAMEAIIIKALQKKPGHRFQTIKDFTEALLKLLPARDEHTEIDTAPLSEHLLKHALMANEVAIDRTGEFRLSDFTSPATDNAIVQSPYKDDLPETAEMEQVLHISSEHSNSLTTTLPLNFDEAIIMNDAYVNETIDTTSPITIDDVEFLDAFDEQPELQDTSVLPAPQFNSKNATTQSASAVVAPPNPMDFEADSREMTHVKLSEQEMNDAKRRMFIQQQVKELAEKNKSAKPAMTTNDALKVLAENNLFHVPSNEKQPAISTSEEDAPDITDSRELAPLNYPSASELRHEQPAPTPHHTKTTKAVKMNRLVVTVIVVLAIVLVVLLLLF